MSFETAWARLQADSNQLAASRFAVQSKELQTLGFKGLGGPSVSLVASSIAYNVNIPVNLGPLNQQLSPLAQQLPAQLQSMLGQLPANYSFNQQGSSTSSSLAGIWPLYLGGASDAARGFVAAQRDEARADSAKTEHELATLLVQRYFGAQLAARAAVLRQAALNNIQQHDSATEKMLAAGLISRIERLQAKVAYEDAKVNALKAQDEADLTATALARTVMSQVPVTPQTSLFVLSQPLEPLPYFTDDDLLHHPGLAKIASVKNQAQQLHLGQEALRKPQVFAFGQHQITSANPDWMAGIGVRWNLFDAIDRNALALASQKKIDQADRTDAQARSDIELLVEKNWYSVEQSRRQFLAKQPGLLLAQEVLRLRTAGLKEGTGTALELIDAEVNQAKVETERAQAAFDYVLALAHLLESCGLSEQFSRYITRADIQVE